MYLDKIEECENKKESSNFDFYKTQKFTSLKQQSLNRKTSINPHGNQLAGELKNTEERNAARKMIIDNIVKS